MFGTSGIRGAFGEDITGELAVAVGRAVASMGAESIVVGRDSRETGALLVDGVCTGARECGADVIDVGREATPTVARLVGQCGADAGVMVTASHNPAPDNGFKLWNPSGQAFDAAQREVVSRRIQNGEFEFAAWNDTGDRRTYPAAAEAHVDTIVEAHRDLEGLSVVVDIGNGAGQVTADALETLGCSITTLHARPDGRFPGRPSEPTADHCTTLQETVAATDHDLGIAHDGDADRMMAVDETGSFLDGDTLLALFGQQAATSGDTVAVPVNTSLLVDDALASVEASTTRTQVGDVYVAAKAKETGVAFGGEPSGAWIWPDETLCPDGPLAAVRLAELVESEGALSDQVAALDTYPIQRDSVETTEKDAVIESVERIVTEEYSDVTNVDGVRVSFDDSWFLIRASGTQPLVRITAQARDDTTVQTRFTEAKEILNRVAQPIS